MSLIMAVAIDPSFVAWGGSMSEPPTVASVWVAPKEGGAATFIAQNQQVPIGSIALGNGFVFWTHGQPMATLVRAPLDGGPPQILATQQENAASLKINGTHAYWAVPQAGEIRRVALEGGPTEVVVTGQPAPSAIGLDDTHLYWGGVNQAAIRRVPLNGGSPVLLYTGMWGTGGLVVHGGFVYWSEDSATGKISRGPVQGGAAQIIATDQDVPRKFDTDGVRIFWFNGGSNFSPGTHLYSAPLDGGARVPELTSRRSGPLVLDGTHVYFAAESLWRITR